MILVPIIIDTVSSYYYIKTIDCKSRGEEGVQKKLFYFY